MKITGGTSATTWLTKREQLEQGNEYRQILPAAEPRTNKVHKKAAAGERRGMRTDLPNSGDHYESGASATGRLTKRQQPELGSDYGQILPNSRVHYEK